MAVAVAKDLARQTRRPIPLDAALSLLPLVAAEQPQDYDRWACRWLARWLSESGAATIDTAAELAGALVDLPSEPQAMDSLMGWARGRHPR